MELNAVVMEDLADALVESHEKMLESLVSMRKTHGLTQDVVAERMGVSQPTVAAFERYDANPTLASIRRYALAVGASMDTSVVDHCGDHTESDFRALVGGTWIMSQPLPLGTWGNVTRKSFADA